MKRQDVDLEGFGMGTPDGTADGAGLGLSGMGLPELPTLRPDLDHMGFGLGTPRGSRSGAGLDVPDPDPLPEGHSLWGRDDVLLTPHVAGRAELTGERRDALFLENFERFAAGRPMLNIVDRAAGY